MPSRSWTRAAAAAVIAGGALAFSPRASGAGPYPGPLEVAKHELSAQTEDALHWLVRGDFARIQHVSIEMVRTIDTILSVAQAQGMGPQFTDQFVDLREQAHDLGEEADNHDLEEAGEDYVEIVETCLQCHVGLR